MGKIPDGRVALPRDWVCTVCGIVPSYAALFSRDFRGLPAARGPFTTPFSWRKCRQAAVVYTTRGLLALICCPRRPRPRW